MNVLNFSEVVAHASCKLLSSPSCSNGLMVVHIVKNNFNSTYCTGHIVKGILG